ncbi:MAG: THxN family PEP-CTERM protein [Candidatus Rokubacteria bacterium]|nr:THxN family PEP-CTERM protein [Candidatus Rokubacteria bacterium]
MFRFGIGLVIVLAAVAPVAAGPLDITNIEGGWQNEVPLGSATIVNAAGQGTDTIRWGTPLSGGTQSGYNFTPAGDLTPVPLGTPFLLGTFQHINEPIGAPVITGVQYFFSFSTNGIPAGLSDTFNFAHNETPNASPCPAGSTSICDDVVTVSSVALNQLITVATDTFFFNLLGFSKDGGVTIASTFLSPEGGTNTAGLFGLVTSQPIGVPEPGALVLMLAGLAAGGIRALRGYIR